MKRILYILVFSSAALVGCTSTNNFKNSSNNLLGGGFLEQEIKPGLYKLTAKANVSPWPSFEAAVETWRGRAEQLCGKGAYLEILTTQEAGLRRHGVINELTILNPAIPRFNTSVSGYVLCNSSAMSRDDAVKYLNDLSAMEEKEQVLAQKNELAELGGSNCSGKEDGVTADIYYRRGKLLMDLNEYKAAMSCFMQVQVLEHDTSVYRDSCSEIGMMYELGWGVEKDLLVSKIWYKKAGL